MLRVLKWGLLAIAAVLGLSLLCFVLLVLFFNPNRYRDEIERWASVQTGRVFTLQGDLSWQLGPPLTLHIPRLRLANPAGFMAVEPFMELTQATVRIALRPLLSRQLQLGQLELQGLRVNLQRSVDGRDNWSDLLQRMTVEGGGGLGFVSLTGLQLQQAEFSYVDASVGRELRLSDLNVQLGRFAYDQPTQLALQTRLNVEPDYSMSLQLSSSMEVSATAIPLSFSAAQLEMQINRASKPMPPLVARIGQLQWDQSADALRVQGLQLTTLDASLNADLLAEKLTTLPMLTTTIAVQIPQLRELAGRWEMALPATKDPTVFKALNGTVQLRAAADAGQLGITQLQLDDTQYDGEFAWSGPDSLAVTFRLHADRLNLDRYLATVSVATPPQAVPLHWLQQLNARGRFSIDDAQWQGIRARKLKLDLDGE